MSSVLEFTPGAGFSVSLPGVLRRLESSIKLYSMKKLVVI